MLIPHLHRYQAARAFGNPHQLGKGATHRLVAKPVSPQATLQGITRLTRSTVVNGAVVPAKARATHAYRTLRVERSGTTRDKLSEPELLAVAVGQVDPPSRLLEPIVRQLYRGRTIAKRVALLRAARQVQRVTLSNRARGRLP